MSCSQTPRNVADFNGSHSELALGGVVITPSGILREDDWASLSATVSQGKCTLMLGPDAVSGQLEGQHMHAHVALATYVKERLADSPDPPQLDLLDPERPSSVAQVAREDPATIGRWISDFYELFEVDADVVSTLASLPFPLVVNTSPGPSVAQAFKERKPGTQSAHYDLRSTQKKLMPDPDPSAPVVYHLYGVAAEPQSMILSDSDRLDFIVAAASNNPPLPRNLLSHLQDVDHTFLFLGFDLDDWQFRILLHLLARNVSRRYKSFAFDLDANPVHPATREYYLSGHKIHFFRGEVAKFVHELSERVDKLTSRSDDSPGADVLPPDAPTVFLCHASEDKAHAERVAAGLRDSGIGTWLDKEDLRGGDQWDEMIRHTLGDVVDYVVVLQSGNLKRKAAERSYVNREIRMALKVQEEYAFPRVFLIPGLLDGPENRRGELEDYHEIDLSGSNGIQALVRTIKRDLEERRVG